MAEAVLSPHGLLRHSQGRSGDGERRRLNTKPLFTRERGVSRQASSVHWSSEPHTHSIRSAWQDVESHRRMASGHAYEGLSY